MSLLDHVGEELKEEREQQQTYVHAVHIGIGGDYDVVISQSVDTLLDVQGRLQQVELVILIENLGRNSVRVLGLASQ